MKLNISIEDLKKLAESKGGTCLSTVYVIKNYKYEWKCSNEEVITNKETLCGY